MEAAHRIARWIPLGPEERQDFVRDRIVLLERPEGGAFRSSSWGDLGPLPSLARADSPMFGDYALTGTVRIAIVVRRLLPASARPKSQPSYGAGPPGPLTPLESPTGAPLDPEAL